MPLHTFTPSPPPPCCAAGALYYKSLSGKGGSKGGISPRHGAAEAGADVEKLPLVSGDAAVLREASPRSATAADADAVAVAAAQK